MLKKEEITEKSDSLIGLLTEQCTDLEILLNLARQETVAAKDGKFLELIDIVSDREKIGARLETYSAQISELRNSLGENDETIRRNEISKRVIEIANLTIAEDNRNLLLLNQSRESAAKELGNLEKSTRGNNAYLRQQTRGLAYDISI